MTAERVISLIIAGVGTLALFAAPVATIIVARMNRRKDNPEPPPPPIVRGQTVDFAQEAVTLYKAEIARLKGEVDRLTKEKTAD